MSFDVVPVEMVVDEGAWQDRCEFRVWNQFKHFVASVGPNGQLAAIQLEINLNTNKKRQPKEKLFRRGLSYLPTAYGSSRFVIHIMII